MIIAEFLDSVPKHHKIIRHRAILGKGGSLSIQASQYHYCEPREDVAGAEYTSVEVGYLENNLALIDALEPWAETPGTNGETVYANVPVIELEKILEQCGGIIGW